MLPDGLLNNQGEISNCPKVRRYLAEAGFVEAIVSLPDYAFRKSGAQNKTSILFFRKFTNTEARIFTHALQEARRTTDNASAAIAAAWRAMRHRTFFAEANFIGYTPTGATTERNELYRGEAGGRLAEDQAGTILGEYFAFLEDPENYGGRSSPDCLAAEFYEIWNSHSSHRLDPKYFLFKREEQSVTPAGWVRAPIQEVMRRRENLVDPSSSPDTEVTVMTLGQNGEIRSREAGKGQKSTRHG